RVVEALGEACKRLVSAAADAVHDSPHAHIERRVVAGIAPEQRLDLSKVLLVDDTHGYGTILFNGYSTIPVAPAALSFGIRSRTCNSVRIVLTATHVLSLNAEIVGFFMAGRSVSTASRPSARTFIIRPTCPCAWMAAVSS